MKPTDPHLRNKGEEHSRGEMSSIYFSVLKLYGEFYERKYGNKFYPRPYHFRQAKELLEVREGFESPPLDEITERLGTFFSKNDDWIVDCRHNFSVFVKHFHRWIMPGRKEKKNETIMDIRCSECHSVHSSIEVCLICNPV